MIGALIGRSGVAPVVREPSTRAEQVTQLVLGETAQILEEAGEWRRIQLDGDGYQGWVNRGYVLEIDPETAVEWREAAEGWSEGAVVRAGSEIVRLPLRSRVRLRGDRIGLPDGRRGLPIAGSVLHFSKVRRRAARTSPDRWAAQAFAGTAYQWGGVTPWGVDCSGLVQTTFLARGETLPRDASQQITCGLPVDPPERRQPGDLLFFAEEGRVTHVAISGREDTLVHAALSCGGFIQEPWGPGTRAEYMRERLVGVRRVK
ncbi:MAG TPA: C40 family peptidase [Gemmatimonadales bacterium]